MINNMAYHPDFHLEVQRVLLFRPNLELVYTSARSMGFRSSKVACFIEKTLIKEPLENYTSVSLCYAAEYIICCDTGVYLKQETKLPEITEFAKVLYG